VGADSYDPQDVAQAIFQAMKNFDLKEAADPSQEGGQLPSLEEENEQDPITPTEDDEKSALSDQASKSPAPNSFLKDFVHILKFCHLAYKKKIPPLCYSVDTTPEIESWFQAVSFMNLKVSSIRAKQQQQCDEDSSDSNDDISSPEHKISKKDRVFLSMMLKINNAMDKTYKDKYDKGPGFIRLEEHHKNLILNALTVPFRLMTQKLHNPLSFIQPFLAKKSQFKAKDMLLHRLQSEKISFNPGSFFVNSLWNCDFFWLLPDTPSGVSIFFCPETKSASTADIERDRLLALTDKVNLSEFEKLAKQKLYIPSTIMDMVWMTQNFHAVIKFCFGPKAHSTVFLRNWADHMYENRNMYMTQHASDPYFFAKVLYAIDHALQKHWHSCSMSDDRLSVNDSVLRMHEDQESILSLSFSHQIPKSISDKIDNYLEKQADKEDKGKQDKKNGGGNGNGNGNNSDNKKNQEVRYNSDKSNPHWRLQEGENFSKVFYDKQKECPKTVDGKLICMKFFVRGLCDKACSRAHSLSKEDSKKFEKFVADCRKAAAKKDF